MARRRSWSKGLPLLEAATVLAAGALLAACQLTVTTPPSLGPSPSPAAAVSTASPSASVPSPSARPSLPIERPAPVLARIPLPGGEDQAPFEGEFAVAGGAIWIERPSSGVLLRVDATTERLSATIPLPYAVALIVGADGSLWDIGPYGGAPDPDHFTLSRIDLASGARTSVVNPPSAAVAVGLGSIWVASLDGLDRLDMTGGHARRVADEEWGTLQVACGQVWGWQDLGFGPVLHVYDPRRGSVFAYAGGGPIYERNGECWTFTPDGFMRIWPSGDGPYGQPWHVQSAGSTFWRSPVAFLEQWNPMTGAYSGERWILDAQDVRVTSKNGLDGKLVVLDGDLWLVNAYEVVRFDLPS